MLEWIKALFGLKQKAIPAEISAETANSVARAELNRLRREELSVSAHMLRGVPVNTFPGLTAGSMSKRNAEAPKSAATTTKPIDAAETAQSQSSDDGSCFGTSMIVGAATGSTVAGYFMGGSLTGAFIGSSMHQDSESKPREAICAPSISNVSGDSAVESTACDSSDDSDD